MRNFYVALVMLLGGILFEKAQAQNIYLKATLETPSTVITDNASLNPLTRVKDVSNNSNPDLTDYATVTSLSFDTEQTINFTSASSGVGAGKVAFNPLTITKLVDASSVKFFLAQCQGKPMKLEILFVSVGQENPNVVYKLILESAFVKTLAAASAGDCASCPLDETLSFEYGSLQIFTYSYDKTGKVTANAPGGWNRMTNKAIN